MDSKGSDRNERDVALSMAEQSISKFSGRDPTQSITNWTQEIEDNAEIFGWTPLQKLIIARRSLIQTAALWLKSERPFKTYDELKSALTKEFTDTINIKDIHELMSATKKKKEETCYEYMLVMKELGKKGKMPDYVAIKYIIDGIEDLEVNKMMLYGVTTYSDLKDKLKIYESMKEKMNIRNRNYYHVKHQSTRNDKKQINQPLKRLMCYACGENGHHSGQCPHKSKGMKCFKCNNFGHIAPDCPEVPSTSNHRQSLFRANGYHGQEQTQQTKKSMCVKLLPLQNDMSSEIRNEIQTEHSIDSTNANGGMLMSNVKSSNVNNEIMNVNEHLYNKHKPLKLVKIYNFEFKALVDSGSDVNLMSVNSYNKLRTKEYERDDVAFSGIGYTQVQSLGKLNTKMNIDGQIYDTIFHIIPNEVMPYDIIIGQEFLKNVSLVMHKKQIIISPVDNDLLQNFDCYNINTENIYTSNLEIKEQVEDIVKLYKPLKIKEAPIKLKIILKDDQPVALRPRRLAIREQHEVDRQIKEWLENKIIRPSTSEYASPVVLVKKKDDTYRMCIDYRQLNKKIVKDEFPLPLIESHIDKLNKARVFSKIDLKNGFFHLKVHEDSVKYTAFVTSTGQYEFLRAPFGLSICPKVFTRFITIIYRELIEKGIVVIFIDDLIIPAESETEAVERLELVLKVAADYGLEINWKKTNLICNKIEYLGNIIENGTVRPSSDKTDAVLKYPEPKTLKQLHSFIGLTSYFRKFILNYALIAAPLTDLLKKSENFTFQEEHRTAFNILKQKLATDPVLKIYDPDLPTELHTDASLVAYSAILLQRDKIDQKLHPVHYMSKKTTDAEKKYTSYELEALAIIEGIKKFRHYLYGIKFKIVTDCSAFQMTLNKKELNTRVARWVLFLQDYDYEIEHRMGSKMMHTDALSRHPYVATIQIHEKIKKAQESDENLSAIIEILNHKPYNDYFIHNGILYKGLEQQIVIPQRMENEIIKRAHENGHFTKKKMIELINKDYYIKDLDQKLENYILNCIPCILANKKAGKLEGYLNPINKEDLPLQTLHLDHIGPLTETKKLYNYILTIVDAFTKFVWIFPTKSTTSIETINKLKIHQQTFGNPNRIITDRGTAFTANEFQDYCKEENIQHVKITTGVPRGNGQVERIHRIIISVLTKLCIEDKSCWYKHVSRLQRALNSTYQRSINTTPFELMIGTKLRTKEDIELHEILQQENTESHITNREQARKEAKESILKIQEENRRNYNKNKKESSSYEKGDLVAIKRTQYGTSTKLKPKFLGPYEVTKVKPNDRYDVQKVDGVTEGPVKTSTSADCMKRWPTESE